jgi:carbon storage regulator
MLVLARRPGETIVIDGDVRITVVEAKGNCVRLGIEAPPHILVDRAEVHERRMQFSEPAPAPSHILGACSKSGLNGHCCAN